MSCGFTYFRFAGGFTIKSLSEYIFPAIWTNPIPVAAPSGILLWHKRLPYHFLAEERLQEALSQQGTLPRRHHVGWPSQAGLPLSVPEFTVTLLERDKRQTTLR